jgi:hypothetical protein
MTGISSRKASKLYFGLSRRPIGGSLHVITRSGQYDFTTVRILIFGRTKSRTTLDLINQRRAEMVRGVRQFDVRHGISIREALTLLLFSMQRARRAPLTGVRSIVEDKTGRLEDFR